MRISFREKGHGVHTFLLSLRIKIGSGLLVMALVFSFSNLSMSAQEGVPDISADDEAFFEKNVRPLLLQKCSECHGAEKQESDFRVDSITSLLSGGASGEAAIVPGKPEQSLLIKSIQGDSDYSMPPEESLSAEEIAHLREWVQRGAPWPASTEAVTPLTASQRVELQRKEHWALQPLSMSPPPVDLEDKWSRSPLDRWVREGLKAVSLAVSPDAERPQILRRLKLDLLGVPPTYDEIQEFTTDSRPDAFERLLDRYLASPAYGERWGRHWMDVARYADTRGYAFNRDRRYPYAYTYRDYVIQALNDDLPYDQFVLEQLAADQLDLGEEKWRLAGLGFLTVGRKFNNAHDDIDDKIDVVTRGLMGLTVACARCHDHKYDAIPTEDYYSLYGVFASSVEPGELPLIADKDAIERNQDWFQELEKLKQNIETYTDERHAETEEHARTRVYEYLVAAVYNLPEDKKLAHPEIDLDVNQLKTQLRDRWRRWSETHAQSDDAIAQIWKGVMELGDEATEEQVATLRQKWLETDLLVDSPMLQEALRSKPWSSRGEILRVLGDVIEEAIQVAQDQSDNAEVQKFAAIVTGEKGLGKFNRGNTGEFLNRADRDHIAKLTSKITAHQSAAPAELGRAMVLQDRAKPAEPVVFIRGNPRRRGNKVPRHFVEVVAGESRDAFENGSGRLDLAEAIIAPANPLTPRVIVNRVWMHHFREPLVSTPSDFGIRCDEPVQRKLLDQMASDLQKNGWSLKELHRDIVLSSVYRQSSQVRPEAVEVDPENRRLWKQNRRRLGFEATRDSLLFVSQQLSMMRGGKAVDVFNQVDSSRRSVYAYIDRQDLPGLLRSFDFASPDQHAAMRPRTVVPQQALYLMNSEFIRHRAAEIVQRLGLDQDTPINDGIQALFHQVLARDGSAEEIAALEGLAAASEVDRWEGLAQVLLETNEMVYVD